MSISLYNATIPTYQQMLGAVAGLLDKAENYCAANGLSPESLIQARLAEDMRPFAYQITASAWHSKAAIEGIRNGRFSPDMSDPPGDFSSLRDKISEAIESMGALSEAEVNGFVGKPLLFQAGEFKMDFIAEDFLFSFSQPNFFFHVTTAYDLLRWKGLIIGKMDFMGQMRKL